MPNVIHFAFVDWDRADAELRPLCGAWSETVTWTTILEIATCATCASLARDRCPQLEAGGEKPPRAPRAHGKRALATPIVKWR